MVIGTSVGDGAAFSCDAGFELNGSFGTVCTVVDADTSEFDPAAPTCDRKLVYLKYAWTILD